MEAKRLENWPKEYFINDIYEVENDFGLAKAINERYQSLTEARGLTVFKDGGYDMMPPGTGNITKRVFIPWHMVAAFSAEVHPLVDPVPEPSQDLLETPDIAKIEGPIN